MLTLKFASALVLEIASLRCATNILTKKKTEKKESIFRGGVAKKPKGNGISAEGWQGKEIRLRSTKNALPLCRSLLVLLKLSLVQAT